jgi:hypothetical protein
MSTGKVIAIIAAVVIVLFITVGTCLVHNATLDNAAKTTVDNTTQVLSFSDRLLAVEQQNAKLVQENKELSDNLSILQKTIAAIQAAKVK